MRRLTIGPPLVVKGRARKGLRGFAGKPFHPPLTDIPVAAYLFGAVFDVLSLVLHSAHREIGEQLFRAGTWIFLGGAAVSLLAALTGWADWHRSSEPGTQARRTINTHALIMITVSLLAILDIVLRVTAYDDRNHSPLPLAILSVVVASLVSLGSSYGGSLVYDYGFNVETAGDHPVWHKSERDVYPGQKEPEPAPAKLQ